MSTPTDERLHSALDELASGPLPVDLADRAIARADRNRRRRYALLTGVAVLAVAAAVPLAVSLSGTHTGGGSPLANPANGTSAKTSGAVQPTACAQAPQQGTMVKEVAPADWPDFVRTTVAALPTRSDYVMQSGWSWCDDGSQPDANAYAVINLGPAREHGHLTVNMYIHATNAPADCAALRELVSKPQPPPAPNEKRVVLFCTDRTSTTPMVAGLSFSGQVTVSANYADGRSIAMESIPNPGQPLTVTAEQLRDAVTDRAVHEVIPDVAQPGPPAEPVTHGTTPSAG